MAWGDEFWEYSLFLTFRPVRASEIFETVKMDLRWKGLRSGGTRDIPELLSSCHRGLGGKNRAGGVGGKRGV